MTSTSQSTSRPKTQITHSDRALRILLAALLLGGVAIAIYSLQSDTASEFLSITGMSIMIASASLVTGILVGFLFGIPRSLQGEQPIRAENSREQKERNQQDFPELTYKANTNLEQISDWLTKILVGVGLTQISKLPEALNQFGSVVAPSLGNYESSSVFAVTLLIYYATCGFLIGYLWTRRYLPGEFRAADLSALGLQVAQVQSKLSEFERQFERDAKALSLVRKQLDPDSDTQMVSPEDLARAISDASTEVREQIFYQARATRRANWKEPQKKPVMERTIPIFRALIASDKQGGDHMNYGQLGFALKDQRRPAWREAEANLTKAIDLRGLWRESEYHWLAYELNRAICRINVEKEEMDFGSPSDPQTRERIMEDLRALTNVKGLKSIAQGNEDIGKWMETNSSSWDDLD